MRNRLRIFPTDESVQSQPSQTVKVSLGDILEPLAEALMSNRTFISDFSDDDVQISSDLYEALMASASLRKAA